MIRILGRLSSINVRKVLWTCHEIGLDYEREDWGRGFRPTASDEFMALNPHALVPVLIDGPTVLWESNTICRYLAASRGRDDLLPSAPAARAEVEKWMDWQATGPGQSSSYAFHALSRRTPGYDDPARIGESQANWTRHMTILDAYLAGRGAFIAGDAFSLADIVLGLMAQRWFLTPFDKPRLERLHAYYSGLCARPAFVGHGGAGVP
ncbi:glutathione S-transferase family protein [Paludibacterium paludis]|uniref:Glutathione S-transferase n=1 Tax=Paludibacterium paludis TaxID=1225769 RepID=A0A918U9Z4_9NEIS|nr:glutathione S-transferase [Paludibacterium paludis]GGY18391.1 glutathione S-transferase [Paludibacterium paludis]